ncbi:hypothetical protein ACGFYE_38260 [Streptomyces zaomyceticus]|uniref:hypothetical protein n=1 Tax=Streptomyces zaomyceticus TaxID=68286 RepID=UPI003716BE4B
MGERPDRRESAVVGTGAGYEEIPMIIGPSRNSMQPPKNSHPKYIRQLLFPLGGGERLLHHQAAEDSETEAAGFIEQ